MQIRYVWDVRRASFSAAMLLWNWILCASQIHPRADSTSQNKKEEQEYPRKAKPSRRSGPMGARFCKGTLASCGAPGMSALSSGTIPFPWGLGHAVGKHLCGVCGLHVNLGLYSFSAQLSFSCTLSSRWSELVSISDSAEMASWSHNRSLCLAHTSKPFQFHYPVPKLLLHF